MSAIKLVVAFGREDHALSQYEKIAEETRIVATRVGVQSALFSSVFLLCVVGLGIYAWTTGGFLVQNERINPTTKERYSVQDILTVYYSLMYGMFSIPQILPVIPAVVRALVSGK